MINKDSWFYKEGHLIGTIEAGEGGRITTETKAIRSEVRGRILDTDMPSRPAVMIDFRAGVKAAWKAATGSTRGAFND